MEKEKIVIPIGRNRNVVLVLPEFDMDMDTEQLTQIQQHNLMGEILTSSALLNKVGNWVAEMENQVAAVELDLKIWQANQEKDAKGKLSYEEDDGKGKGGKKKVKPTIPEVEAYITSLPAYRDKHLHLLTMKKDMQILRNFFWSVKSKDDKLVKLSEKIRPEEFEGEIVEERINSIMIRCFKGVMPANVR